MNPYFWENPFETKLNEWISTKIQTTDEIECQFRCIGDENCYFYVLDAGFCYLGNLVNPPKPPIVEEELVKSPCFKNGTNSFKALEMFQTQLSSDDSYELVAPYIWKNMIFYVFKSLIGNTTETECAEMCLVIKSEFSKLPACNFFVYFNKLCQFGNFGARQSLFDGVMEPNMTMYLRLDLGKHYMLLKI